MSEESANGGASKAKNALLSGAKSGAFAAASGGVTLLRAVKSLRKGDRKRAVVRLLAAGFWFGVAGVQRRSGGSDDGDVDERDVADTTPDIGDVATDADEGTGPDSPGDPSDVVDTTTIDIDESDTATEFDGDADENDIDQRDVTGTNVGADDAQRTAEPGSVDNMQDLNEESDADPGRDDSSGGGAADTRTPEEGDTAEGADIDIDDADDGEEEEGEEAEPKSLDDDAEPAITERDDEEE